MKYEVEMVDGWKRLSHSTRGFELTELMAAKNEDGVGIIATWKRDVDDWDTWKVHAMDTEGGDFAPVVYDSSDGSNTWETGEEPVPPHPPVKHARLPERILCAAIYVDTGKAKAATASRGYPKTGLVFTGLRHSDCFTVMRAWEERLTEEERNAIKAIEEYALRGRSQGFITSHGRFVDREEGYRIAVGAGQVPARDARERGHKLFSEDLY